MSIATTCGATLLRSLFMVLLAAPLCLWLCRLLGNLRGFVGRGAWMLLLLPFFFPDLITAYAYSNFSLSLIQHPYLNLGLYFLLITMKIAAAGAVMMYFSPPAPLSDVAIHCLRLGQGTKRQQWRRIPSVIFNWSRGPGRAMLPAMALMFFLSFQEFEIASLLGISSWTVWLFDAQAGGLPISDSLYYALLPLVCEAAILFPLLFMIFKTRHLPSASNSFFRPLRSWGQIAMWFYLLLAAGIVALIPFFMVLRGGLAGAATRLQNISLTKEIFTGGLIALTAGTLTYAVSAWLFQPNGSQHNKTLRLILGSILGIVGLLGSFMISLILAGTFQVSVLHFFYSTPLPWLLALILFLMPRAIVLQLLLIARKDEESFHLGSLLKQSPDNHQKLQGKNLLLQMQGNAHFWSLALVCYWAYLDLTAASLLAPTGMVSAPVRLYNLMHYGQSAVLSATVCAAFAIPILFLLFVFSLKRPLLRWLV